VRALGAAAAVTAAGLGYARWEAGSYRLRRADVVALPAGHDPVRVLHLSDLHLTPQRHRLQSWVTDLAGLSPDLVLVTGDIISHTEAVPLAINALAPLGDVPAAFVLGSNDYYEPRLSNPLQYLAGPSRTDLSRPELPWQDLIDGLTNMGWHYLGNSAQRVSLPAGDIDLRGVDDPHIDRDNYGLVSGPTEGVTIGVAHAPYRRVLDAMADDDLALIVAGHTHGGQLRVPGFGALVTNSDLDRRRARGVSVHRQTPMHVSAGLGTSPYTPFRFACPPEATLLTLSAPG